MTSAYRSDRVVFLDGAAFNGDSPLPVVVRPDVSVEIPGENLAVPASSLTTIMTYTNAGTDPLFVDGWTGKGQFDGDWDLYVDTVRKDGGQSVAAGNDAQHMFTSPIRVAAGGIVDLKVTHYGSSTGEFKGTILGHR